MLDIGEKSLFIPSISFESRTRDSWGMKKS